MRTSRGVATLPWNDVEALHAEVETLRQETRRLQEEVEHQKERFKDLWRANCQSQRIR